MSYSYIKLLNFYEILENQTIYTHNKNIFSINKLSLTTTAEIIQIFPRHRQNSYARKLNKNISVCTKKPQI